MDLEDNIQLPIIAVNLITVHILMSVHPQDTFSRKLDRLRKSTAQGNQLTRLSPYINTGFLCDKKSLPTDLHKCWNHRETLSTLSIESRTFIMMNTTMNTICMINTQYLMSEHSSDSISNRLALPEKNTSQKKYITRVEGYNNTDQLCDRKSLPTDLPESWSHKEPLHNRYRLINHGDKIIPVTHKEVYILSRPSKLQPVVDYSITTQCTNREKEQDLPQLPSTPGAQEMYQCTYKGLNLLPEPLEKKMYPYRPTKQTLVQHRQNTSWEPATVMSQSSSNSYWIMQENGTDQPRVYRRTRTMLKIRCTDIRQTRHNYSQSTESQKAKFQTPSTSNEARS